MGWEDELDAVCLILVGTAWHCSGTLINNDCQDLTPYILTANHCVSGYANYDNWVFRFGYESFQCNGVEPQTWISFNGADLRASWANTDFALLELNNSINDIQELALAGWNRSATAALTAVGIHHPSGDVKKIAVDNDQVTAVNWLPIPGQTHWRTNFDEGIVQDGSSGSPLFDQNQLIIGQLHGNQNNICDKGDNDCFCNDQYPIGEYGRIDLSWAGGGNNNNRLRNWLGNNSNPQTTNTIRVPWVAGSITECPGDSENYTLQHPIPGKTVTWQVNPASAVVNSTGSGSSANVVWRNDFDGYATITFILGQTGCNNVSATKDIRVGTPSSISEAFDPVTQSYVSNPKINKQYEYHAITPYNSSSDADYNWTVTPPIGSGFPTLHSGKEISYTASTAGMHTFELKVDGYCGWSSITEKNFIFTSSSSLKKTVWKIFPNPSNNYLSIKSLTHHMDEKHETFAIIRIYSSHGQLCYENKHYIPGKLIPLENLRFGIYKIIIHNNKNIYYETFVKE